MSESDAASGAGGTGQAAADRLAGGERGVMGEREVLPEPIALWPGEFAELGGRRVHVRRDEPGDGGARDRQRTVYVHGLGGAATNWTDLMGELCPEFAGEALDLPGFGDSPPPADGDYGLDAHAAAVVDLIREGPGAAGPSGPVHLVGNSMGAAVATRVAAEHPELVRTLTLVSPALPDLRPRLVPYQMTGALVPVIGPAVYARVQGRPPEVRVQGTLDVTYYDPTAVPAQRLMEALEAERERDGRDYAARAVLGSLRGMVGEYLRRGPRALWRQAARVECPTLLVYARHDRFVHPRMAARAARTFRRNRLVLLSRAGHVAMMERPATVAGEMRPFLLGADEGRSGTGTVQRIT
ncbi:pimeloyl-ACP methyl ester carboxylesterase [Spinactinospora alkalitolerans]|uniref:Pimeloyl-ACP methyl ester carboxylesterase n=1 Tax=Spinactinospora alkalitolerans TaxID=687207 RepID=A0A852TQ62_9ACTN|nr:alpha/beta fold hydrolase [Spinactinospora alkalitolerans]NYE45735.1 pimeloyl-ACP methyl ester carboxylesterase [Spinactinospora alkalitolerans]